tara:strand:- start:134 stop:829 length:696 start_codon:yes stop_codon:yes gene_type:complete
MRITRIFLNQELVPNKSIILDKKSSIHLSVLKLKKDEEIELFNSSGFSVLAKIIKANKRKFEVKTCSDLKKDKEKKIRIHLGIAEVKNFDKVLNESTQLGADKIYCLNTERSKFSKVPSEHKKKRWDSVINSACEQSGNNWKPEFEISSLADWIINIKSQKKYFLDPSGALNIREIKGFKEIFFAIGPEGGFSNNEKEMFFDNGFESVSMGDLILKTETTPTALLSMLKVL